MRTNPRTVSCPLGPQDDSSPGDTPAHVVAVWCSRRAPAPTLPALADAHCGADTCGVLVGMLPVPGMHCAELVSRQMPATKEAAPPEAPPPRQRYTSSGRSAARHHAAGRRDSYLSATPAVTASGSPCAPVLCGNKEALLGEQTKHNHEGTANSAGLEAGWVVRDKLSKGDGGLKNKLNGQDKQGQLTRPCRRPWPDTLSRPLR